MAATPGILSGPDRWPIAIEAGEYFGKHPEAEGKKLNPLPKDSPTREKLAPIIDELCGALDHMLEHHMGILLMVKHQARTERKMQRKKARELCSMMRTNRQLCHT